MKKFFNIILVLLGNIILTLAILLSAQKVMNLPFGWECIEYYAIFFSAMWLWAKPITLKIE